MQTRQIDRTITAVNLSVAELSQTGVLLSWPAAVDNDGADGYRIYSNGEIIGDMAELSFAINDLTENHLYTIRVEAKDGEGNLSQGGPIVTFRTLGVEDTTPPAWAGNSGLNASYEEGEDIGLGEKSLRHSEVRRYFRLCAVRRLEQAANILMDRARKAKNLQKESAVDQVKRYIDEHYAKSWGLQDVADHVAVSRSYLAKLFKEETGMTIWTYCVNVRMSRARDLLLTSSLRSYEIALEVGYENSIHFSRIFKQFHGLNPMEYKGKFSSD